LGGTKQDKKFRVLCVPDLHSPYQHPHALDFLSDVARDFRPNKIVILGDEFDGHAFSVHPKEPELYSPGHEYDAALHFMKQLYKLFPSALVCLGNHTLRPWRVAKAAGLPSRMLLDYNKLFEAPVTWRYSDHWFIDGVKYEHGDKGGSGRNAIFKAMFENRCSTVIGHIHGWPQVIYSANEHGLIFGMNAGCLVDLDSLAFAYAHYRNKGVLGCGVVIEGEAAYFIKMPLSK
jgi:hypothetical protein